MFYEVIPIRLFREDGGVLTYSSEERLQPGQIVEIPLGRAKTLGIVLKPVKNIDFKTKPILRVLYSAPLPPHILKSILWLGDYYLVPLPLAAKLFLPQGLGKKRRNVKEDADCSFLGPFATTGANGRELARNDGTSDRFPKKNDRIRNSNIPLNPAQIHALQALESVSKATKLLHGVTGSGKTNIYLKLAENALKQQQSVILLVPEIALTSQLVQIFAQTFENRVKLIHSNKTEPERQKIWEEILESDQPQIIIGPRSALLTPVKNPGLIIIDEAHESTYYQENTPKYSALRLASFIANSEKITCLYGTATPLIQDYYLADTNQALVSLSEKAKTAAKTPDIKIIDLKDRQKFVKNRYFSDELITKIKRNLDNHHQTLIFHNRRGSAPLTLCENCGWQALCPNCYLPLTLHSDSYSLLCHACGYQQKVPTSCPDCRAPGVVHKGFGTKLLETELKKLFKDARIARFDADNKKTESLDAKFTEVKSGQYGIVIGTQTIAKGLDLPLLATVGVVQADSGLNLPDFAAEEHTFSLITQVIGRVGRGHLDTAEVIIQTYQPNNQTILTAAKQNYAEFYDYLLKKRKQGHLPPFYYLAKITLTYKTEQTVLKHLKTLHSLLKAQPNLIVSAPTPAFHERTKNGFSWQIVLRATSRKTILSAIKSLPKTTNFHFEIDPPSLL